jgi:IS5 family transposase
MIGRRHRQSSLFYVAFGRQASLIKDDLLEPLDVLLDDEELIASVAQALGRRHPRSRMTGRPSIAPDRLLRCLVLKHLKGWSFRELERELRGSLVYRRFTRFDQDPVPDFTTFSRVFAAQGEDLTRKIHARVVAMARQDRIAPGRKLRTDTTVVESNVHYPTDSSLLSDGVRVLTRALGRIASECTSGAVKVVDHARATKHRVLEINRAAKSFTASSRARFEGSYQKMVGITAGVLRQAEKVCKEIRDGKVPIVGDVRRVVAQEAQIEHYAPLVRKVIAQTKARVFRGDTHVAGKVLSLFEEHTQAICKGKAHKSTEFGRLIRLDEVENGIISNYDVKDGNPADQKDFLPAVSQHTEIFGRAPQMATADRGFHSGANERGARGFGVKKVALPARGRLSKAKAELRKKRWFQRALRWRAGIEGRIGTLKHRFGLLRAHYKGDRGFKRYVGWSIITNNLVSVARVRAQRKVRRVDAQAKHAA